jgi:hypothetical protein
MSSTQRRLQAAVHGHLQGLRHLDHPAAVDAHELVKAAPLHAVQASLALACQQIAELALLVLAHLLVAQGQHLLVGEGARMTLADLMDSLGISPPPYA